MADGVAGGAPRRVQRFDLNIDEVLSHWEVKDALRELIANAIDESLLSHTATPDITYDDEKRTVVIRDYGRGLEAAHLVQSESREKAGHDGVIGRFGVGLKDALAVLYENGKGVSISSRHMRVAEFQMSEKAGFDGIRTLHAMVEEPGPEIDGTLIEVFGIDNEDVSAAKELFLRFAALPVLALSQCGEVLEPGSRGAEIFINGMRVAEDEKLRFSYNITKIDASLRKNLNRERNAVGRTAYTGAVKNILKGVVGSAAVWDKLSDQLLNGVSEKCDELRWKDIECIAATHLSGRGNLKPVYMTPEERNRLTADDVEHIEEQGRRVVFVSEKTRNSATAAGLDTIAEVNEEYNSSFDYKVVEIEELAPAEREVLGHIGQVAGIVERHFGMRLPPVIVSETMRAGNYGSGETLGLWVQAEGKIYVKRTILGRREMFLGVLLHEYCHYISSAGDNSRDFENALTDMCGLLANELLPTRAKTDDDSTIKIKRGRADLPLKRSWLSDVLSRFKSQHEIRFW